MDLHAEQLRRFRLVRSTDLPRHAGQTVVAAGMLTTSKPVHTARDEPMEFATFDDGHGLIETVLFPRVYRERGHILFDQGPFLFRGKVEEEFGAISVTITQLERWSGRRGRGLWTEAEGTAPAHRCALFLTAYVARRTSGSLKHESDPSSLLALGLLLLLDRRRDGPRAG
jgi:DNA polymerase III alpha subunit